jgi:hypothetical protein
MERNEQETSIDKGPLGKLMKGLQELPKEDKAEACQDLLKLIFAVNSKIDSKTSSRHFSPALPIGHPVALVRAFFRLESAEIPMEGVKEMDFPCAWAICVKRMTASLDILSGKIIPRCFFPSPTATCRREIISLTNKRNI